MIKMRHTVVALVLALVLTAGSAIAMSHASTENALKQLETAITHSGFSAGTEQLGGATTHLGHALNCLVGEGHDLFDAGWGHPCNGQGSGALHDIGDAPASLLVQAAIDLAAQGVDADDVETVHLAANGVKALLQVAADSLK